MAKAGNPVALRLCIERLVPTRRGNVVEFELPRIEKAQDIAAAAAVIEAAAHGKLSLAEARHFMHLPERSVRPSRQSARRSHRAS